MKSRAENCAQTVRENGKKRPRKPHDKARGPQGARDFTDISRGYFRVFAGTQEQHARQVGRPSFTSNFSTCLAENHFQILAERIRLAPSSQPKSIR